MRASFIGGFLANFGVILVFIGDLYNLAGFVVEAMVLLVEGVSADD